MDERERECVENCRYAQPMRDEIERLRAALIEADWLFSSMPVQPAIGTVPHDWRDRAIRWIYAQKNRAALGGGEG